MRRLLAACIASLLAMPGEVRSQADSDVLEVRIATDNAHGAYYFEPAGLYVQPGQTVRFVSVHYFHSVTAYHPDNGGHELRIPAAAAPFDELLGDEADSGRESFEVTFQQIGTYDFHCRFHESRGEVGRIVVGRPGGPAEELRGDAEAPVMPEGFVGLSASSTRLPAVQRIFEYLDSRRIVAEKSVSFPRQELKRFGSDYHPVNVPIPDD